MYVAITSPYLRDRGVTAGAGESNLNGVTSPRWSDFMPQLRWWEHAMTLVAGIRSRDDRISVAVTMSTVAGQGMADFKLQMPQLQ